MRDKIAGALYGMALGDAMGMPAELWGRNRARKFFHGKITELLDGPAENDVAFNYKKGQFTDDTGQALVLLDSIASTITYRTSQTLPQKCSHGLKKKMPSRTIS